MPGWFLLVGTDRISSLSLRCDMIHSSCFRVQHQMGLEGGKRPKEAPKQEGGGMAGPRKLKLNGEVRKKGAVSAELKDPDFDLNPAPRRKKKRERKSRRVMDKILPPSCTVFCLIS